MADGRLHRFALPEDRHGEKTGWYCLFADGVPAGAFGSWREGEPHRWSARRADTLTAAERDALLRRMEQARRLREEARLTEAARAASVSAGQWEAARKADPAHPYLQARGVDAFGLRQAGSALLVPMRDSQGRLKGLQRIFPDGSKRFVRGVAKAGLFHRIEGEGSAVYVCEGYATGASLHMATGQTVVVAFDAGNLEPVARALRQQMPHGTLILAADNDHQTRKPDGSFWNTGLEHARQAAAAVGAPVVWPDFASPDATTTDFNDLHRLEGLDAVRRQAAVPDGGPRLTDWDVRDFAGQARPQRWLVDQTLPLGAPCLLAAAGGTGKGLLLLDLGLTVASGLPAPAFQTHNRNSHNRNSQNQSCRALRNRGAWNRGSRNRIRCPPGTPDRYPGRYPDIRAIRPLMVSSMAVSLQGVRLRSDRRPAARLTEINASDGSPPEVRHSDLSPNRSRQADTSPPHAGLTGCRLPCMAFQSRPFQDRRFPDSRHLRRPSLHRQFLNRQRLSRQHLSRQRLSRQRSPPRLKAGRPGLAIR